MQHIFTQVPSKLSTIIIAFEGGARSEGDTYSPGIAHMLEHMMFKGTNKRSYLEIPKDIAFLGGDTNAFTSNEMVAYYITVPYENLESAMEILSDMVFNSSFPEEEFLKEREVVKEEELGGNDHVSSFMWRKFIADFFGERVAIPVIGTQETIDGFTRDELVAFYEDRYAPEKAIVSLCGNHEPEYATELLVKYFGEPDHKVEHDVPMYTPEYKEARTMKLHRPELEHTHVWMCYPGLSISENNEAVTDIMLNIFGQGMDSRLFTEVREKHGLCYGISASMAAFRDYSTMMITASTRADNVDKMIELIESEVEKLKNEPVSEEELQRARNKYKAETYAITESSGALARTVLMRTYFGECSLEELDRRANLVTPEDIMEAAKVLFDGSRRLTMLCDGESAE